MQTWRPRVTVGIPTRNRSAWLRRAVESVLAQTHEDFAVVISDNASTDDTPAVVASLADPRIAYHRSEVDLGMFGNLNRAVELAETEYVVVLPDDDLLYPDYLASVLEVFGQGTSLGVVHSAFDLIDENGETLERGRMLLPSTGEVTRETGPQLIERAMRSSGTVCWTSACFRKAAYLAAGGIREKDDPYADAPLMMRIALNGDFACVSRPLVAVRIHANAESASVGAFTGSTYDPLDDTPAFLYRQRLEFLDEAELPSAREQRYRALARSSYRRETVGRLTVDLQLGRQTASETVKRLYRLGRVDLRMLSSRATVKLAAVLLVGVFKRRSR